MSDDNQPRPNESLIREHLRESYRQMTSRLPAESFGFESMWNKARSENQSRTTTRSWTLRLTKIGFGFAIASLAVVLSGHFFSPSPSVAKGPRIVVPSEIKQLTLQANEGWNSELLKTDTGFVQTENPDYELALPRFAQPGQLPRFNKKGS